jgi:serine/threonine-protein kinase RsbW/stage II sporulation protein AB (anti-sigma F factor)
VEYARRLGLAEETLQALRLAVSEAATNVVLHAYADAPAPGPVHVSVEIDEPHLRIVVSDDGGGMKPRPDSPGLGLGLPLIAQLAESFEVESPPGGGTELCMRFRL